MKKSHLFFIIMTLLLLTLALLSSGCASKSVVGDVYEKTIPKTPQQAAIKTLDSTSCQGCHLDPEVISSFEKTKEASAGGETEGG